MRALKVCSTAGCPELCPSGRCTACQAKAEQTRGTATQRGYGKQWRAARRAFLRNPANVFCSEPGCLVAATDVDHIDGLGPSGPRGFDHTNLRAYCHSHHSKRTAADQPGGWNRR